MERKLFEAVLFYLSSDEDGNPITGFDKTLEGETDGEQIVSEEA